MALNLNSKNGISGSLLHNEDGKLSYNMTSSTARLLQQVECGEDRLVRSLPGAEFFNTKSRLEKYSSAFPSPLDRLRTGKRERAAQLGITTSNLENSFDANQSFPKSTFTKHKEEISSPVIKIESITALSKGIHDVSFNRPASRGSFGQSPLPTTDVINQLNCSLEQSLNQSWIFYNYTATPSAPSHISTTGSSSYASNPNKAVITINARTTEILICNDMACELFGYADEDLISRKLSDLLSIKKREQGALEELELDPETGEIVKISGRIMEAKHAEGIGMPVSVWTSLVKSDEGTKCVVVLEPVQKIAASATISQDEILLTCDNNFVNLFGYQTADQLKTVKIKRFLPSLKLPTHGDKLSAEHKKQSATGLSKSGYTFPVSAHVAMASDSEDVVVYDVMLWVFTSISGLVTVSSTGMINAINDNFSKFLCGYHASELISKLVTDLLPDFAFTDGGYEDGLLDSGSIPIPLFEDEVPNGEANGYHAPVRDEELTNHSEGSSVVREYERCETTDLIEEASNAISNIRICSDNEIERASTADLLLPVSPSQLGGEQDTHIGSEGETDTSRVGLQTDDSLIACDACRRHRENLTTDIEPGEILECTHSPTKLTDVNGSSTEISNTHHVGGGDCTTPLSSCGSRSLGEIELDTSPCKKGICDGIPSDQLTSTPSGKTVECRRAEFQIQEGCYSAHIQHKDQSLIGVIVKARRIELADGEVVNCLWISQDPEMIGESAQQLHHLTLGSSFSQSALLQSTPPPVTHSKSLTEDRNLSVTGTPLLDETIEFPPADGPYREMFKTTLSVGKGAFGFVKLAQRRADRKEFVVKFIRKSKVLKDCWLEDEHLGKVSLEISLLAKLEHSNIVKLVDVFENKDYFQLVMERHGSGIDLFEFIEKNPNMDERLASYIFRQVVEAVSYLHGLSILHRDIKDENIIMNEHFEIKLIDFGSASFLRKGRLFSTFCGTIEYCSPEVLQGNKYRGPELEVWSMGVTLYTLIFGENPFYDVEETIEAVLKPPFIVSPALMQLIQWMLHPDPLFRARVRDVAKHKWITQPVSVSDYSWERVLPNYEFRGNVAADNRPDPLDSDEDGGNSAADEPDRSSAGEDESDDDDVRQEMIKVLNQQT